MVFLSLTLLTLKKKIPGLPHLHNFNVRILNWESLETRLVMNMQQSLCPRHVRYEHLKSVLLGIERRAFNFWFIY